MEIFPNMLQYLQCVNCQKFLGDGSLICEVGHPFCSYCGKIDDQCRSCSIYTSDVKSFTSTLHLNTELMEILKKCFSRCRNVLCKHLVPIYIYENHMSACDIPNEVSCTRGCGIMTKRLGKHLIRKHGYRREEFINDKIRLSQSNEDWGLSKWSDFIVNITATQCLLICPKIEQGVFVLGIYNLNPSMIKARITVRKGWNTLEFKGIIPFFEETLVKTTDIIFWNCELNTLKDSFLEYDTNTGLKYLDLQILKIE